MTEGEDLLDGPRMTPPMTSAMTRGCLMRFKKKARSWIIPVIMTLSMIQNLARETQEGAH